MSTIDPEALAAAEELLTLTEGDLGRIGLIYERLPAIRRVARALLAAEGRGEMEPVGLTLHQAAQRLIDLASKIERASSEAEENELCNQRDALLALFRKADAVIKPSRES